jgi:hypothetical protein
MMNGAQGPASGPNHAPAAKHFGAGAAPLFRPQAGDVVLAPEAPGSGYWVGAPSVLWDAPAGCWWLTYRRRRPRGVNPDGRGDRGYVARIARSTDGLRFEDVWEVEQRAWSTPSMERFSLALAGDGGYVLYVSYVDPQDNRWRIDLLQAARPEQLDARRRQPVFTAGGLPASGPGAGESVEGVKDPVVFRAGDTWYMLVSYAAARPRPEAEHRRLHETADVYNTGLATAPTALATSGDGFHWAWQGQVLPVGAAGAWDAYQARLTSVVPGGPLWLGFYDGAASERENYEERCGLVVSRDLRAWTRLTPAGPALTAPHGSGSVRYVDAVRTGDALVCYYEYARPDGAHELRRAAVALP